MSDFEEFNKELPSKERFYSSLTNRKITDKTYEHVLNVWNKFEIKTMKDYHDLYLRCNALLFANVFEKFKCQKFMWLCNIQIFSNKWIQINKFDLNKYTSNHLKGYILKIDLKNPKQL